MGVALVFSTTGPVAAEEVLRLQVAALPGRKPKSCDYQEMVGGPEFNRGPVLVHGGFKTDTGALDEVRGQCNPHPELPIAVELREILQSRVKKKQWPRLWSSLLRPL